MKRSGRQFSTRYKVDPKQHMNRIPALHGSTRRQSGATARPILPLLASTAALLVSASGWSATGDDDAHPSNDRVYQVDFIVTPQPDAGGAWVELKLGQSSHLLREVNMRARDERISAPEGDGEISLADERLIWKPPPAGL